MLKVKSVAGDENAVAECVCVCVCGPKMMMTMAVKDVGAKGNI